MWFKSPILLLFQILVNELFFVKQLLLQSIEIFIRFLTVNKRIISPQLCAATDIELQKNAKNPKTVIFVTKKLLKSLCSAL
jgi:hypothetical protein